MYFLFKSLAISIFLGLFSAQVYAQELSVYEQWKERYVETVDTHLNFEAIEYDGAFLCSWKSKLWIPCKCSVIYRVKEIQKKPPHLELKKGDRIQLKYPCDKNKEYRGKTQTLPWITPLGNRLYAVKMRSSYLEKKRKNKWKMNNEDGVFKPLMPDGSPKS